LEYGVEEQAQQLLRTYINTRRTALKERFYNSIEAEPDAFEAHLRLYCATLTGLKPVDEVPTRG
jgi:hypothetical protein